MSLSGLLLVLTAAVCHATWNFFVKRINGGPELIWLFSLLSTLLYLPAAVWVYLVERPAIDVQSVTFILVSTLLHLGYFLFLQTGYRKGDLSLIYPIARATGPMLSTAFAIAFLGEYASLPMVLGGAIIIFGVLMLVGGIRPQSRDIAISLSFGLGAGLFIGSYTAWDAYTVSVLLVPPLLLDFASTLVRCIILTPMASRKRHLIRDHWTHHKGGVLAIAVFNPLAYILVLYALTFTPVAYVAPLREVSVLLSVLAGSLLMKEGHLKRRLFWGAIILAGMMVLVSN